MKYLALLAFLLSLYSCERRPRNKRYEQEKETLITKPDTFNVKDLERNPSLQKSILINTISEPANKKHLEISIAYPIVSPKELPEVWNQINSLITNKRKEFYEMTKDEKVLYDTSMFSPQGWRMWIEPKSLYYSKRFISFAIQSGSGFTEMPAGFEYNVINYDIEKKKKISLADYFILNTSADSSFLENIIGRSSDREFKIFDRWEAGYPINFSFDDSSVYFFFDKYDVLGFGIFSIERKFILEHINPAYR